MLGVIASEVTPALYAQGRVAANEEELFPIAHVDSDGSKTA